MDTATEELLNYKEIFPNSEFDMFRHVGSSLKRYNAIIDDYCYNLRLEELMYTAPGFKVDLSPFALNPGVRNTGSPLLVRPDFRSTTTEKERLWDEPIAVFFKGDLSVEYLINVYSSGYGSDFKSRYVCGLFMQDRKLLLTYSHPVINPKLISFIKKVKGIETNNTKDAGKDLLEAGFVEDEEGNIDLAR